VGSAGDIRPSEKGYTVTVNFPSGIFEPGNIPQYLSVVAGGVFSLRKLEIVRLLDLRLPDGLVPFHGPKFGISGIRRLLGTIDRPHIGAVIRPNFGPHPKDFAEVAYEAALGGSDFVMDDVLLTNQAFCTIHERVPEVIGRLDEARSETGQKTIYAVNITTLPDTILERAASAVELGADMVMVHIVGSGYGALKALVNDSGLHLPIHVHCIPQPGMARITDSGIARVPVARLARMLGGDQFMIGSVNAEKNGFGDEVVQCREALTAPEFGHRRSFPVVSGGIHPGNIAKEIASLGKDILVLAGDGFYQHPDGLAAGMKAIRQAVDAFISDIPVNIYANDHYELRRSLKFFEG
jgi:ribulose-bisphosphate carboxylase large chain